MMEQISYDGNGTYRDRLTGAAPETATPYSRVAGTKEGTGKVRYGQYRIRNATGYDIALDYSRVLIFHKTRIRK